MTQRLTRRDRGVLLLGALRASPNYLELVGNLLGGLAMVLVFGLPWPVIPALLVARWSARSAIAQNLILAYYRRAQLLEIAEGRMDRLLENAQGRVEADLQSQRS